MLLRNRLLIVLAVLLVVFAGIAACAGTTANVGENSMPVATGQSALVTRATETQSSGLATRAPPTKQNGSITKPVATKPAKVNGFQTIAYSDLPPEAKRTLGLIESNGPFPYRQDGQVFQNREGILPKKQNGYYHEYTVETPGSDDRGARRIIAGDGGELYYTADHYSSFNVILTNE